MAKKKGTGFIVRDRMKVVNFNGIKKKKNKKTRVPRIRTITMSATRDLACSMLDPFECSACVPDGRTNTGCFSIKQTGTLSTGAAGTTCGLFLGMQPSAAYALDSGSTATTTTYAAGTSFQTVGLTAIAGQYQTYRVVSAGIRLTYIGNTQTDAGLIVAGQTPSTQIISTNYNGLSAAALANSCANYQQVPLRNGVQVTWRPESLADMSEWKNFGGTALTHSNFIFPQPVIFAQIFGAAANSTVAQFEFVINLEGQFLSNGFIPGGVQSSSIMPPKSEPGWYEKVKSMADRVAPIFPLVGSILTASGMPSAGLLMSNLGGMANGIAYPSRVGRSSRLRI